MSNHRRCAAPATLTPAHDKRSQVATKPRRTKWPDIVSRFCRWPRRRAASARPVDGPAWIGPGSTGAGWTNGLTAWRGVAQSAPIRYSEARLNPGERCLSGLKERFAKPSQGLNLAAGSNPALSVSACLTTPGQALFDSPLLSLSEPRRLNAWATWGPGQRAGPRPVCAVPGARGRVAPSR
jgi:hypothetical protein